MKEKLVHLFLLLSGLGVLIWSGINPHDRMTWYAEVAPAVIGAVIFICVYKRFRFTTLAYVLAWWFSLILIVGGHYTYARVPMGNWVKDAFELSRNHYDRMGHFFQGFVPAILAREILLRTSPLRPGKWLIFIVVSICLSISALYEFIEWGTAVFYGDGSDAFLGTQGDPWDAHWDMFLCTLGAAVALLLLSRWHDRGLSKLLKVKEG